MYNGKSNENTLEIYNKNSLGKSILVNPKWGESLIPKFEYTKEGK